MASPNAKCQFPEPRERLAAIARALDCRLCAKGPVFSGVGAVGRLCRLVGGKACDRNHPSVAFVWCPAHGFPITLNNVSVLKRQRKTVAIINEPYILPESYEADLDRYCIKHELRWKRSDSLAAWSPGHTLPIIIWRADTEGFECRLSELLGASEATATKRS